MLIYGRWIVVLMLALVVIGLIAYARGDEHHHGDDVGALGSSTAANMTFADAGRWSG